MPSSVFRSRTWLVVSAVALLVAVFLGVMFANRAIDPNEPTEIAETAAHTHHEMHGPLRPGESLPEVAIVTTNGMSTGLLAFTRDYDLVILLVSSSCPVCDEIARQWSAGSHTPGGPRIIGMCDLPVEDARAYAQAVRFAFPLLCDTGHVLAEGYEMDIYPTAIGVLRGGEIAYVRAPVDPAFTREEAIALVRPGE